MKDTLADIREKLRQGLYQNEEHVRLSLVARLLQELGWDIWNPKEVNAEFVAVPSEDRTKVDVALFASTFAPSVFIEVKAYGGIRDLPSIEQQVRDYNRNNTAPFSIITDGAKWRFYYSQAPGEFSRKCFKVVDLLSDDVADIEAAFTTFLLKHAVTSEAAEDQAKALLKLNQKQRVMEECLPRARRVVQEAPFPNLPEALMQILQQRNITTSMAEVRAFIEKGGPEAPTETPEPDVLAEPDVGGLDGWCRKHRISTEGRTIFERIVEYLRSKNKEVSYKVGGTAMSISCFGRAMAFVFPRKSGIHLHFFVRNSPIGEARVLLRKGKPGKWASMTLRNQRELEPALPWLEESLRRLHQAVSRNETTDWRLPRDEA